MLGKLLKYEMKASSKLFLPMYAALIAISLIRFIFSLFEMDIASGVFLALTILAILAVIVLTYVMILQRFFKNLLGNEGYLMFTLPVSVDGLLFSKIISAFIWFLSSAVTIFISCVLCIGPTGVSNFIRDDLPALLNDLYYYQIFIYFSLIISGLLFSILLFYTSMALGHLSNAHRLLYSVVAYIGLHTFTQFLYTFALLPRIFRFSGIPNNYTLYEATVTHTGMAYVLLPIIFISVILSIVFYFITRHILHKRLNLA